LGSRLGDKGSGFWIGREALGATLEAQDGVRSGSNLTATLLARRGGRRGIVCFAGYASAGEVAALAPEVIAAAESADPVGRAILQQGADYLQRTLADIGWSPGAPLCLLGGVANSYRHSLPERIAGGLTAPRGNALDGALQLARQLHGGPVP
jgi:glucosamine kinase